MDTRTLAGLGRPVKNKCSNSAFIGAAVGVDPTGWQNISQTVNGVVRSIAGVGVEDGKEYMDIRMVGTPTLATTFFLSPPFNPKASAGQLWTASCFLSLRAGSWTGFNDGSLRMRHGKQDTSSVDTIADMRATAGLIPILFQAQQIAPETTISASLLLRFGINNGAAVDVTFRIAAPQVERGRRRRYVKTTNYISPT